MYCATHNKLYYAEAGELCPDCAAVQERCAHANKGVDKLFGSRRYHHIAGEWDRCYDCGKLIPYKAETMPTATKIQVLQAIESERRYQEEKYPGHAHTIAEWLLIINHYADKAQVDWVNGHGDNKAVHDLRKIAAIAVAAMEQCGAPLRGEEIQPGRYASEHKDAKP